MVANKCQTQSKPTQSQADIKQNRQTNAHTQTGRHTLKAITVTPSTQQNRKLGHRKKEGKLYDTLRLRSYTSGQDNYNQTFL